MCRRVGDGRFQALSWTRAPGHDLPSTKCPVTGSYMRIADMQQSGPMVRNPNWKLSEPSGRSTNSPSRNSSRDFDIHVGQHFSIGYSAHTNPTVSLYIEKSFTYLNCGPEAAIALTYQS